MELLLGAGEAALAAGDWTAARAAFEEALGLGETPEVLSGLGTARWWLGEIQSAMSSWERAYAGFLKRDDPVQAVQVAIILSLLQNANFGNRVVSAGWAARAERLAGELGEPALTAWVALARMATCDDPAEVLGQAQRAHDVARESGDRDLELCACGSGWRR